jgi:predicted aconitase with swiveling domain
MSAAISARVLIGGEAAGEVLRLDEPLSLWGGLDPETGRIIDPRHPQHGEVVTGRILVLPYGRGSSSASAILLESVRQSTAPSAVVLREVDGILALGAAVAREMYERCPPVLVASPDDYDRLTTGSMATISGSGEISIS